MTAIKLKMNPLNTHVANGTYPSQINEQFLNFVKNYLFVRQIQSINALWEISVNSFDKNLFDQFDDFVTQLEFSSREIIADIYLLKELENEDSWTSVAQTMNENTMHENQSVGGWSDIYLPRKEYKIKVSKNCCTQTELNRKNTSEIYENCNLNTKSIGQEIGLSDAISNNKNSLLQPSSQMENVKIKMHHPEKEEEQLFREENYHHCDSIADSAGNSTVKHRKWQEKINTQEQETSERKYYIKNKHNYKRNYKKSNQKSFENLRYVNNFNLRENNKLNEILRTILVPIIVNWINYDIQPKMKMRCFRNDFYKRRNNSKIII